MEYKVYLREEDTPCAWGVLMYCLGVRLVCQRGPMICVEMMEKGVMMSQLFAS